MRFLLDAIQDDIRSPKQTFATPAAPRARDTDRIHTWYFHTTVFYIVPQIGKQAQDMSNGLVRFYHQSIVPFAIGNEFNAVANQPVTVGNSLVTAATTLEGQLDEGKFPSELREAFQENEIGLSSDIQVSVKKRHSRWLITDTGNGGTYAIQATKIVSTFIRKRSIWGQNTACTALMGTKTEWMMLRMEPLSVNQFKQSLQRPSPSINSWSEHRRDYTGTLRRPYRMASFRAGER